MKSLIFLSISCVCLFTGCATQPTQATKESLSAAPATNGILFGTYARSAPDERFGTESVYLRKIGQRKWKEIGINTLPLVPLAFDYKDDGSYGSLFVMTLPAGNYEIYDFAMIQQVFGGSITHSPSRPFSVPFSVIEGKMCYLGELKMDRLEAKKFLGLPGSDNVRFELSDQSKRDIALLKNKYPEVQLPIEIVKPACEYSNPFIRIE